MYLAACRKGQRNDRFRDQPFSRVNAPKRAFSLKASYMRTILEFVRNSGSDMATNTSVDIGCLELVNTKELENKSFEDILTERLMEFRNLDYKQIARHFDIDISPKEKSKYAKAVKHILSDRLNKFEDAEEIRKAGIIVKTIRIRHNGHIRESMSFENIDYQEFMDTEDWTQSRWYEIITSRFMFIIFKEAEDGSPGWTDEKRYVLDRVLFWTMPEHDITIAEKYWEKSTHSKIQEFPQAGK